MTDDKEISKKELKRLRTMIEQGQKLSISTKEFEKVFDEIERLEQESMTKSATFCNYEKQLDELKQENSLLSYNLGLKEGECDKLEQENKELKDRVKAEIHLGNNYKKDFAEQVTIAENYRSALEEIRELVEKSIKISYNLEVNSMLYDITDKINKCLGE